MRKIVITSILLFLISVSCRQVLTDDYLIKGRNSLYVGEVVTFSVEIKSGGQISSEKIKWESSNEEIFVVDNTGVVSVLAPGVARLAATFEIGDEEFEVYTLITSSILNGKPPSSAYVIDGPDRSYKGQRGQFAIISDDSDGSDVFSVSWTSGNTDVLFVDEETGDFSTLGDDGTVIVTAFLDTQGGEVILEKEIALYDGTLVLEYDISNQYIRLPLSFRTDDDGFGLASAIPHDLIIDWGDGEETVIDVVEGVGVVSDAFSHDYSTDFVSSNETVLVSISGEIIRLMVSSTQVAGGTGEAQAEGWIDVKQWGNAAFIGPDMDALYQPMHQGPFGMYGGVDFSATDSPYLEGCLGNFFNTGYQYRGFNPDVGHWDTSSLTNMSYMFHGAKNFNQDISNWDVSNVTNMKGMFFDAENFNQDISNWDVSNVTDMSELFYNAGSFNRDLDHWDTSSVTNMSYMFSSAASFDGSLAGWDVSNVVFYDYMFSNSPLFSGKGLDSWKVYSWANFSNMFNGNVSLNVDLSSWVMRRVDFNYVSGWEGMFAGTNLDIAYHPQGCTSECGIDHP